MKNWHLAGTTAALAILAGSGAFADVTPEEVWQNWQDMASGFGQTVTTETVARDGDTLAVTGLTITMTEKGDTVTSTIAELDFTDMGDGTVEITMSESYPLSFKTDAVATLPAKEAIITISAPELVMTASGTVDAISYDIEAASLSAKLDSVDGAAASAETVMAEAVITNIIANYLVEGVADKRSLASQFSADQVSVKVSGTDPEDKTTFTLNGEVAELAGQSNGTLGTMAMAADLGAALKAGAAFGGNFSHGASSFDLNMTEERGPTAMTASFGGGSFSFAMDQAHMRYDVGGSTSSFTFSSPDIPLPQVQFGYDDLAFTMDFPVAQSDSPAEFTFLTKIVGLAVSEDIWNMIDMQSLLPHDPATLIIDTKGKVKVTGDLFATPDMAEVQSPPVDIEALDITALQLSIAGAELTGNGALTFDNTDKVTFDGMPTPTGKVDLKLTGANTLLDKIVQMGYLKAEDVAGFRMMAAMFTNSATDKDELTSALEFKDKGFYANGQRLK